MRARQRGRRQDRQRGRRRPRGAGQPCARPTWVVHADWGADPRKQQVARAWRQPDGTYLAGAPRPFGGGEPLAGLGLEAGGTGGVLAGFDFSIGLPAAYAAAVGITSFRDALPGLGTGEWREFFEVATAATEIGLRRPFYPMRSQGAPVAWADLEAGLGIPKASLRRRCEAGGGESLFWTLGGRQVGKAAISGWRAVLQPLLAQLGDGVGLWPFDGSLDDLLERRAVVVAETYPALFYRRLGFGRIGAGRGSKRRQDDRRAEAPHLRAAAAALDVTLDDGLAASIADGFGRPAGGEDAFDAVVGLLGLLAALAGPAAGRACPADADVRAVEGWMLGLAR